VVEAEEKCSDLLHRLVEVICETRESWWEVLLLWLRNLGGSRGICDLLQRLLDITNHLIHLVNCNLSSNPDQACKESSLLANLLSWLNKQDQANFDQMSPLSMALLVVLVIFLHLSISFVVVALFNPFAYDFISRVYNTMEEKVVTKSRRTRSRSSRKARSSSSRRASSSSTRGTSSKTSRWEHSSTKSSSSVSKSMRTTLTAVYDFFKGFLTHVYDFFSSIVTFVYDIISGLFSTKEEKVVTKSRSTRSRSSRKARSSSSRRTSRSSTSSKTSRRAHSSTKSSSSVSDGKQVRTVVFDFFSGLVTSVYNFFKSLFTFVFDFILGLFNTKEEMVVTRTRRTSHSSTKSSHQLADEEPVKVVIKEEIRKRPAASKKKSKSKESSNVYELDIFDEAQVVGSGNLDLISTSARPHLEGGPRGGD